MAGSGKNKKGGPKGFSAIFASLTGGVFSRLHGDKKKQEMVVLIVAATFAIGLIGVTWVTDGAFLSSPWQTIKSFARPTDTSTAAVNCMKASNKNTPYCRNRSSRVAQDWGSISQGGSKPFNLH